MSDIFVAAQKVVEQNELTYMGKNIKVSFFEPDEEELDDDEESESEEEVEEEEPPSWLIFKLLLHVI